jgi:signal transduction histidine kinase
MLSFVELFLGEDSPKALFFSGASTIIIGVLSVPYIERIFRKATDHIFFKDIYNYAAAMRELSEVMYTHTELSEIIREAEKTLIKILRSSSVSILLPTPAEEMSLDMLCIPIKVDGKEIGSIVLGPKRSGDPYTTQDLQLLQTFAYQAATALSRAQLYDEVRRHAAILEQRVEERTHELRQLQENQQHMMLDISHNLQTPLTILQNKLDTLKGDRAYDGKIESLEQSLSVLSHFMYDLLKIARLEQGQTETYDECNISGEIEEVIEEIRTITESQNIHIISAIEPHIIVLGNKNQLREAVMNIVSNAVKYLRTEGSRIITMALRTENHSVIFSVADTGVGISEEDLPHVFERFYRAHSTTRIKGSGLGLAITKKIIEQHRGQIKLESAVGVGTTVTITLPITKVT